MPEVLEDLTKVRLEQLLTEDRPDTILDVLMRRLFDPDDPEKLTVSAFGSAL